jgi:hypothetical protein
MTFAVLAREKHIRSMFAVPALDFLHKQARYGANPSVGVQPVS